MSARPFDGWQKLRAEKFLVFSPLSVYLFTSGPSRTAGEVTAVPSAALSRRSGESWGHARMVRWFWVSGQNKLDAGRRRYRIRAQLYGQIMGDMN